MDLFLHEKALKCAREYKHSESALIEVLTQIDKTKTYLEVGVSSLFRYCVEKLGLSEGESFRFIQVARKSIEVPELKEAISKGLLTVSKASRIASVITSQTQSNWIEKAVTLTQKEIEKEVQKETGLPLTNQLKIKRAKEVLRSTTLEDTLEKLIDFTLHTKDPLRKAARNKQVPTLRKAVVSQVGRAIPSSLKHQVYLRDFGECTFKQCKEKRFVEIHHIQPLSMGGRHALENLTTLCSNHHKKMHPGYLKRKTHPALQSGFF